MKAQVTGTDFELPPEGLTIGRCYRVIDLGTQEKKYNNNVDYKRQILVSFELPLHMMEIDGEPQPMAISKKYTLSFNKKANLRIDMEAWYGKKFNDKDIENSEGFDPAKILGRPCQINIVYSEDGNYANISGLMPLAAGQKCPDQINPSFIFDLDEFDRDKWDQLSEKMQGWIVKSPECQKVLGTGQPEQHNAEMASVNVPDGFDDLDIPF